MAVAIPFLAIAATVASTAVGVVGQMQQASAQSKAAKSQAQAAEYNAQVAMNDAAVSRMNGQQQIDQGNAEGDRFRTIARRTMGSQRATAGASGIDLSGSFQDVEFDSLLESEFDILNSKYKGQIGAWNNEVEANRSEASAGLSRQQAKVYNSQAKDAKTAGMIGAGATILGGISSGISTVSKYSSGYGSQPMIS